MPSHATFTCMQAWQPASKHTLDHVRKICCALLMMLAGAQQEDTRTKCCAWKGALGTAVLPQQPALMCTHTVVQPQSQLDELIS